MYFSLNKNAKWNSLAIEWNLNRLREIILTSLLISDRFTNKKRFEGPFSQIKPPRTSSVFHFYLCTYWALSASCDIKNSDRRFIEFSSTFYLSPVIYVICKYSSIERKKLLCRLATHKFYIFFMSLSWEAMDRILKFVKILQHT